ETSAASQPPGGPASPVRVFESLRDRCQLGPSSRILEIGAGSGQATRRLAASGASVVAVEPNIALAGRLRERLRSAPGVVVVVATFEDVELEPSSFDLVAVATAFHWLDPELSLPKIVSLLRRRGWLALWWNEF